MREGILGGSFDPVHNGHVTIAREAVRRLSLDRLLFMPARVPPHKRGRRMTDATHRLAMIRLALADEPKLEVSTLELDRTGTSYSVDTVGAVLEADGPDTQLFFIVGADQALELHTWKRAETLVRLCTVVAVARPGVPLDRLEDLRGKLPDDVVTRIRADALDLPPVDVSSTQVRTRVAEGKSIAGLVPPAVAEYIREQRLYR
ncbi:MAG TPA: nicotinate-nucleotide adenylyltransferase [Planctomycetota bacterium]|nr:nicotinate-nucleotide adenylyltransferase [Planctomycetota bacterium]